MKNELFENVNDLVSFYHHSSYDIFRKSQQELLMLFEFTWREIAVLMRLARVLKINSQLKNWHLNGIWKWQKLKVQLSII
jgi:hypothetical protein